MGLIDPIDYCLTNFILHRDKELILNIDKLLGLFNELNIGLINGLFFLPLSNSHSPSGGTPQYLMPLLSFPHIIQLCMPFNKQLVGLLLFIKQFNRVKFQTNAFEFLQLFLQFMVEGLVQGGLLWLMIR